VSFVLFAYLIASNFAVILTELNDHVNARKAYKRALQMDPDDFVIRLNYAVFEYRHGEPEACKQALQNVKAPRNIDQPQFSVS
jgi:Tfp pilus assembly protein PilF